MTLFYPLLTFFFVALSTLSYGSSNPSPTSLSPITPYYRPSELFDQTPIIDNHIDYLNHKGYEISEKQTTSCFDDPDEEEYITLLSFPTPLNEWEKKFQDETENHYWHKRRLLYARAIAQETASILFLATPLLIGYWIATGNDAPNAATMLLTTAFLATVYSTNTLRALIVTTLFPSNDPYVPYELAYSKKKLALDYLDQEENSIRRQWGFTTNRSDSTFLTARLGALNPKASFDLLETLIRLPTDSRRLTFKSQALRKHLELYSKDEINKIMCFCENHRLSFSEEWGINNHPRQFMLLLSPPGHGKTYCVNLIAQHLGIQAIRINLSNTTPEKLYGTKDDPGILLSALIESPYRNAILFFDELCHIAKNENLFATLLTILDPTTKTFYSPYLQKTIDVSHYFIIAAGNEDFNQTALKNRFNETRTIHLEIQNKTLFFEKLLKKYPDEIYRAGLNSLQDHFSNAPLSFRDGESLLNIIMGSKKGDKYSHF